MKGIAKLSFLLRCAGMLSVLSLMLGGCAGSYGAHPPTADNGFITDAAPTTTTSSVSEPHKALGNPAIDYCALVGGEYLQILEAGKAVGYCLLKDGQRINAWELFRAEHRQQ